MKGTALAAVDYEVCASCEEPISHDGVTAGGERFCCTGCRAGGPCVCTGRIAPPDFDWQDEPPLSRRLAASTAPPLYSERAGFRPARDDAPGPQRLSGPAVLRISGLRSQGELLELARLLELNPRIEGLSLIRARLDDCWFSVTVPTVQELELALLDLTEFEVRTRTHPAGIDVTVRAVDLVSAADPADIVVRRPRLWQVPRTAGPAEDAAPGARPAELVTASPTQHVEAQPVEAQHVEVQAVEPTPTQTSAAEMSPLPPPATIEPAAVERAIAPPYEPAPHEPTSEQWAPAEPTLTGATIADGPPPPATSEAAQVEAAQVEAAQVEATQVEAAQVEAAPAPPPAAETLPTPPLVEPIGPDPSAVKVRIADAELAPAPRVVDTPRGPEADRDEPLVAADARPGGAAPLREHLTVVVYPFSSFATLNEFQDAVRALHGVTNVKVRRFYRGTLHLAVEYEDIIPFAHRLRELDQFRWEPVAERDAEVEIMLVDDGHPSPVEADPSAAGERAG